MIGPDNRLYWTYKYKNSSGSSTTAVKLVNNPQGATGGTAYLYKRTALYAYVVTPGKPNKQISVPKGADTIEFSAG
jgi:hypothetical protein